MARGSDETNAIAIYILDSAQPLNASLDSLLRYLFIIIFQNFLRHRLLTWDGRIWWISCINLHIKFMKKSSSALINFNGCQVFYDVPNEMIYDVDVVMCTMYIQYTSLQHILIYTSICRYLIHFSWYANLVTRAK